MKTWLAAALLSMWFSPAVRVQAQVRSGSDCDCRSAPGAAVEYGQPRPVVDAVGNLFGIPSKLMYWDRRVENHRISPATVDRVEQYLAAQNLTDVKVRVNQYAPIKEWQRLVANRNVAPGWKYTAGVLQHVRYTLLPGRVFGGDEYNPFTNTVSLYSDVPEIGMAEAAYAKDVASRAYPGTYAVVNTLPIVSMWHENLATGEVLNYVALRGSSDEMAEARRKLYVRYGITLGGEVGRVLPDGSLVFQVVGAGVGHLKASRDNAAYAVDSNQ